MRNSHVRSVRVALAVFLAKLRLALSNRILAVLFHLDNKRVVSHIISQVRKALMKEFVPYHLNLQHINRQTAIEEHQTAIATILHTNKPNQLCVVADGTYIFIQKSSNNQLQRKSYSMHKHRNLVKPMILTTTDGYILCALGPFFSDYKNNDASILKHSLYKNEQDIINWLHKDNVLIVDRGFRDVIPTIKHFGYEAVMPSSLNRREQLSTEEANYTRLITKVRWIIESVNGQIKQWKYFSQTIQNSSLRFISNYLDITCALINAFRPRPVSDIHAGSELAYRMLEKFNEQTNIQVRLSQIAKERSDWKKYDAQMCLFPELSQDDVRSLCCGSYQVKQAISYIQEHLTPSPLYDDEFEFIVQLSSYNDDLVRARFSSRYSNNKNYIAVIQYDNKNTEQPINGWYCTCTSGRRDVGCCVHVAALLWHLGVRRAEIELNTHPLSASEIYSEIIDSVQFSDVEATDDEETSSDDEV
ncbi:unnamed protein product [Rotaria sp. Silwood2]|nr:unnamed protein product [Rotaria sp. Silwood2]